MPTDQKVTGLSPVGVTKSTKNRLQIHAGGFLFASVRFHQLLPFV